MTCPTGPYRPPCGCAETTAPIPCDAHEAVAASCPDCRPQASATVWDRRCDLHRTAALWAASGLAYDRVAA